MMVVTGRSGNGVYHTQRECPSWPENPTEHPKDTLPHHRQCAYCERLENGESLTQGRPEESDKNEGLNPTLWLE